MSVYIFIVIGTLLCGIWYDAAHSNTKRWMALSALFLVLFIPAAIRFELGGDCVNVYMPACDNILTGQPVSFEPFFVQSVLFLDGLVDNIPQTIFATFSFLTLLFAILSLCRPCFMIAITTYVLLYYPFGLSGIRQALALSIMLFAIKMYLLRRYVIAVAFMALAFSSHYTILTLPVLYFLATWLARRTKKTIHIAMLVTLVIAHIVNPMSFLTKMVESTRYAFYLTSDKYMDAAQLGSGLGVLAMLFIAGALYFLLMMEFEETNRRAKCLAVFCAFSVILRVSGLKCEALRRMSIIGDALLPFAMAYLCQKRPSLKNYAAIAFLMLGLCALYVKDVSNPNPGSLELYPYKTIFGDGE